jgi:hypothetical protein
MGDFVNASFYGTNLSGTDLRGSRGLDAAMVRQGFWSDGSPPLLPMHVAQALGIRYGIK